MTTATVEALTEREMRQAIERQWDAEARIPSRYDASEALTSVITHVMANPLVNSAVNTFEANGGEVWEPVREPEQPSLWIDLRPSQAARLIELTREACERAEQRCKAVIVDELTAAGLAFAAEDPEATA